MKLPEHFSFNQQNLQDYHDCPRRFYLRHVLKQAWPALESEPVREQEDLIALGERFHRTVQQLFAGVPRNKIEASIAEDADLSTWWNQFIQFDLHSLPGDKYSEVSFSVPFEKTRLTAKFDLLIYSPNQPSLIYDWKTSQHSPKRSWLSDRMQTHVYPFVFALLASQTGSEFTIPADNIHMIYWYPAFPDAPIQFDYSQTQFETDQQDLHSTIQEIFTLDESGFTKTDNEHLCEFCQYRSLCNRGVNAGDRSQSDDLEDEAASSAFEFDFDQISPAA